MTIRAEIDKQDIVNVLRETRGRFPADMLVHGGALAILTLIAGAACIAAYDSFRDIAAGGLSPAQLIRSLSPPTPAMSIFAASLVLTGLCIFCALAAMRARRAAEKQKLEDAQTPVHTTGRFDYAFTAAHLVIQGAAGVRKTAWAAYDRIEETKSNIVFRKPGGDYDFIPKNVLKEKDFLATLNKNFGPAIKSSLAATDTAHGAPLTLTYELSREDGAEYRAACEQKRFGRWRLLRLIPRWRPLAPFAFLILGCAAIAAFVFAMRSADLLFAAGGFICAMAAAAVFVFNSGYFRGPAHPFRKPGAWPYGQTELVTVTLSDSGIYVRRQGVSENFQWRAVDHVLERRLTAYLVMAPGKTVALPKRAFLSQEHFRTFAAYAKKRVKQAHDQRAEEKQQRMMRSLKVKTSAPEPPPKTAPPPQSSARPRPPAKPQAAKG